MTNTIVLREATEDAFHELVNLDKEHKALFDCLAAQRYIKSDGSYKWMVMLTMFNGDSLTHISDDPAEFPTVEAAVTLIEGFWDAEWDEEW